MITRVALLCDSPDEKWPSMDTVGMMLAAELEHAASIHIERIAPPIQRVTGNFTADRLWFRFVAYPRWLKRNRNRFDLFHIVDHSYSQLAHDLPPERVVITCHDLDTFRSVLQPQRDRRNFLFRAMTRRILTGFKRVAHVACDSNATLDELLQYDLLPPDRVSVVPLGVHPSCSPTPDPVADREAERLLGPVQSDVTDLLHVGSTIARKRIDILLRIVATLHRRNVTVRLIRVGGPLTAEQRALARELNVEPSVLELPFLTREVLSACYRRSALVLQPSEMEGFGLPVAEAMACGTLVVASDLPVLREVGGKAAVYCRPRNVDEWASQVERLLQVRALDPGRWGECQERCCKQAARFSWKDYAASMVDVYNKTLNASRHNKLQ